MKWLTRHTYFSQYAAVLLELNQDLWLFGGPGIWDTTIFGQSGILFAHSLPPMFESYKSWQFDRS